MLKIKRRIISAPRDRAAMEGIRLNKTAEMGSITTIKGMRRPIRVRVWSDHTDIKGIKKSCRRLSRVMSPPTAMLELRYLFKNRGT
jgi:hypothetical protein